MAKYMVWPIGVVTLADFGANEFLLARILIAADSRNSAFSWQWIFVAMNFCKNGFSLQRISLQMFITADFRGS